MAQIFNQRLCIDYEPEQKILIRGEKCVHLDNTISYLRKSTNAEVFVPPKIKKPVSGEQKKKINQRKKSRWEAQQLLKQEEEVNLKLFKEPKVQEYKLTEFELKKLPPCEKSDNARIVGGQDAKIHSWPWQFYLSICGDWWGTGVECNVCGASLIASQWSITAAHCIPNNLKKGIVYAGGHILKDMSQADSYMIESMFRHPKWSTPDRFDNDIGLVSTKINMVMRGSVLPVCLPHATTCFREATQCITTGWGLTSENGDFPDKLQEVAVEVFKKDDCKVLNGYQLVKDTAICAGYNDGRKDACSGDSGGPLVCRLDAPYTGAWVLYGIVSWGYGCARPGNPGVYTSVREYTEWIQEITGGVMPDSNIEMDLNCDLVHKSSQEQVFLQLNQRLDLIQAIIEQNKNVEIQSVFNTKYHKNMTGACDYPATSGNGQEIINMKNLAGNNKNWIRSEFDSEIFGYPEHCAVF